MNCIFGAITLSLTLAVGSETLTIENSASAKSMPTEGKTAEKSAKQSEKSPQTKSEKENHLTRQNAAIEALEQSLGRDVHHHHNHNNGQDEPPPTAEELKRRQALSQLTEARLMALATYLTALMNGESDEIALKKAGVPVTELDKISFLSERYYPARAAALDMESELKSLNSTSAPSSPKEARAMASRKQMLTRQLQAHDRFRGQYFKKIAPEIQALVVKNEPKFVALVKTQQERQAKLKAEARMAAVKGFDDKAIPGLMAYLNAKSSGMGEQAAVKASGLSEQMILGMSILASEYGASWLTAHRAEEELPKVRLRLEEKKKARKSGSFEERLIREYEGQIAGYQAFRNSFAAANGQGLEKALFDAMDKLIESYARHEDFKNR